MNSLRRHDLPQETVLMRELRVMTEADELLTVRDLHDRSCCHNNVVFTSRVFVKLIACRKQASHQTAWIGMVAVRRATIHLLHEGAAIIAWGSDPDLMCFDF
jgi:hypothetical protein